MKYLNLPQEQNSILTSLIEKVRKDYGDQIDGIVCYGSMITGTSHRLSDLDFFYIPNGQIDLSFQFIYKNIGYDFFPISWTRLERFASYQEDMVSIVVNGKLVYARNDQVEERFAALKIQASKPADYDLNRAIDRHLKEAKALFFDMYQAGTDFTPRIIEHLVTAVAYLNRTHILKSISQLEKEVTRFKTKPIDFLNRISHIISNTYLVIHNDLEKLILEVCQMAERPSEPYLTGYYEELKSTYNKVYIACEAEDFNKVYFTLSSLCHETKTAFGKHYDHYDFPDLSRAIRAKDFNHISKMTKVHEDICLFALKNMGIQVQSFENFDDLNEKIKIL